MSKPLYFQYGETEIQYLKAKDKKLGEAMERIGPIERAIQPDLYKALVNSIVGQQISSKAQATIWGRMEERFLPFQPELLGDMPLEELQGCGISLRKATYIQEMSQAIVRGELDLRSLPTLSDQEIADQLVKLKGIGLWTAEMILIFSLQRPDVVSYGDLAIQRGLRMLYRHRQITPELFKKYQKRYSPYGTVASLYLWAISGGALLELTDPALRPKRK